MKLTDRGRLASGDDNVVTTPGHRLGGPAGKLSRLLTEGGHPSRLAAALVLLSLTRNPSPEAIQHKKVEATCDSAPSFW